MSYGERRKINSQKKRVSQKERGRRHIEKRRGRVKEKERREEAWQKREKVIKKKKIIIIRAFSSNVLKMLNTIF